MTDQYTKEAINVLRDARKAAIELKHGYIGTEHLLLGLVKNTESTAGTVLREFAVEEDTLKKLIIQLIGSEGALLTVREGGYSPRAQEVLEDADRDAQITDLPLTGTEHILMAIITDTDCAGARLMRTMNVDQQAIYKRLLDIMDISDEKARELLKNVTGQSTEGDEDVLDQYGRDLTRMAREGQLDPVIGRERETERLMQILSRKTKNNPCLIGEPGVGKTAIVEGLAQRIALGSVPDVLQDKRLVSLDMASMVAGTKFRGEFEERMKKILNEVMAERDVLLFIDELHTIIGAGGAEGALDASNIMKPFLSRGQIQVVGATTVAEYRKYIEKDAALERRFQPVMVEEPTVEETVDILRGLRPSYEDHHHVTITDEALHSAAALSKRYINDRYLPDKAIDLMDESCAKARFRTYKVSDDLKAQEDQVNRDRENLEKLLSEGKLEDAMRAHEEYEQARQAFEKASKKKNRSRRMEVTSKDIADTVASWTGVPAERITVSEGKRLMNLDKELHRRVIGQEEAVNAVARAIRRGRAGLKDPRRPVGSFLFLGPTGVGKTELAKAVAQTVFGDEQNMIRVDMSEYMEKYSVSRMVGSPPGYVGYEEGGQLTDKVRSHPYSVILFDEIEKAHPDVFNILLQVLDEGHITDSQGRRVDFKNTVLIMTSNAGAQRIISPKHLGFGAGNDEKENYEKMKSSVMEEIRQLFKPEFLNRIDDIIVFHPLCEQDVKDITDLLLKELRKRSKEQMNLTLNIRPEVRDYIARTGYDARYGARPLKRTIQTKLEDQLSEEILSGRAKPGDTVTVSLKDEKTITFRVRELKQN